MLPRRWLWCCRVSHPSPLRFRSCTSLAAIAISRHRGVFFGFLTASHKPIPFFDVGFNKWRETLNRNVFVWYVVELAPRVVCVWRLRDRRGEKGANEECLKSGNDNSCSDTLSDYSANIELCVCRAEQGGIRFGTTPAVNQLLFRHLHTKRLSRPPILILQLILLVQLVQRC